MVDETVQGDAEDRISRDRRNLREARALIVQMREAIKSMQGYIDHMPTKKHEAIDTSLTAADAWLKANP